MQVLGKVDAGFTQWRGTMLSVSLTIGFMILLILTFFNQELVSSLLAISKADVKSGSLPQGIYKRRLYQCMLNLATAKKCHYQVRAGRGEEFENKSKIFFISGFHSIDRGGEEREAVGGGEGKKPKTRKRLKMKRIFGKRDLR